MTEPVLEISGLRVHHSTSRGMLKAVDGVDLVLRKGETLGLVGESGCGKSTLARCVVGLTAPTEGNVRLLGSDTYVGGKSRMVRGQLDVQMVFQDPMSSLNPRMTIEKIISQPLDVHGVGSKAERRARVKALMDEVGLGSHHATKLPHELSGGQRQRVSIARALSLQPQVLVCDEAVSALDVSVQAQILNLLVDLQAQHGLSLLFISHDLSVVRFISDRIAVMYLGRIVESGPAESVWNDPLHPYTSALLSSNPDKLSEEKKSMAGSLRGDLPSPVNPPSGCGFRTRCEYAVADCAARQPLLRKDGMSHLVACHRAPEWRAVSGSAC